MNITKKKIKVKGATIGTQINPTMKRVLPQQQHPKHELFSPLHAAEHNAIGNQMMHIRGIKSRKIKNQKIPLTILQHFDSTLSPIMEYPQLSGLSTSKCPESFPAYAKQCQQNSYSQKMQVM